MTCYQQKIHYTSIYIFYLLFISRQILISQKDLNTTSTSGDTWKTILLFYLNCFLLATHLNLMRLKKRD